MSLDFAVRQAVLAKFVTFESDGPEGSSLKKVVNEAKRLQYFSTLMSPLPQLESKVKESTECDRLLSTCTSKPFLRRSTAATGVTQTPYSRWIM